MSNSSYNKYPATVIEGDCFTGWSEIISRLKQEIDSFRKSKMIVVFELYSGVCYEEIREAVKLLEPALIVESSDAFLDEGSVKKLTWPDVTDDAIFGRMTRLTMNDLMDPAAQNELNGKIEELAEGIVLIIGHGASLVCDHFDLLVYADMARWEIQQRMKRGEVHGLGINDSTLPYSLQYKRGYFTDWRVCDSLKKKLFPRMDYILDTNRKGDPKMIAAPLMFSALKKTSLQPFRVVPYFDPGPWGGQWMKEVCDLDKSKINFAWCFDCVPEENSLLLNVSGKIFEIPSVNLVFLETRNLLGEPVEARFGQEFPIRFDFLDTMGGGNLSLQVHPTTQYIRETFGMHYTQDESYYMLDAGDDATVYLGVKNSADRAGMMEALKEAQRGGKPFQPDQFINRFKARKHDHFLIPAGTVHCSGANSMVLEISATPYIFTFKIWDWERPGLDGKPRPINLGHAENVIDWARDSDYCSKNLINRIEEVSHGDGWREERTGLHENEFIETRRHWFSKSVLHQTNHGVNVLNLVEGEAALVESPLDNFEPLLVHFAETFIIPAAVGQYTIRPYGPSEGKEIATIKAFVRF